MMHGEIDHRRFTGSLIFGLSWRTLLSREGHQEISVPGRECLTLRKLLLFRIGNFCFNMERTGGVEGLTGHELLGVGGAALRGVMGHAPYRPAQAT